ncbi:tetratricopeptide repeat protein [Streptomyces sp. DSM 44917]|uniref:Tetratricopeptide repeat protein n=1 Tax=Streptomyces boetiae TaxID=3075541 RepID=A0ABU2L6T9_9ACTN|nr:helix-turn-helix domain-containing protein [Streptomyces sp. DSM 44917]MDT0307276.1 tetratricopeptide repeat protein [Streptomyces sp. DSM 44917]
MGENRAFGKALRQRREERGLSLRRLGAAISYSPGWLSRVETGAAEPTLQLAQACDAELQAEGKLLALARAALAGREGWPRPAQLPAGAAATFVGRQEQLDALDRLWEQAQAASSVMTAVIDGPPGAGKSALAIHWGHRMASAFPDGVLFTDLRGYGPDDHAGAGPLDPEPVLEGFLTALGVPADSVPTGLEERSGMLRSVVQGRRVLLVLDNAADSRQVEPLLLGAPGCAVLVTSRRRLTGVAVRSGAQHLALGAMPPEESQALLAAAIGPRAHADPQALRTLAQRCAHLPLALRIAAERVAVRGEAGVAELAAQLSAEPRRLDLLTATGDEAAVQAAFSWSYRTLPPPHAKLFRLLGLHPARRISIPAAAALADAEPEETRRRIEHLADAHLLEEAEHGGYALHDLLRVYAASRAAAEDSQQERDAARQRLVDWYLLAADAAGRALAPQRPVPAATTASAVRPPAFRSRQEAYRWFETEAAAFTAITRLAADQHESAAWQLPVRLWTWLQLRKPWTLWKDTHETGLEAARSAGDAAGEAWIATNLAEAWRQTGQTERAEELYTRALAIRERLDSPHDLAWTLAGRGYLAIDQGDSAQAARTFTRALHLFTDIADRHGQAAMHAALGEVHSLQADQPRASACLEEALSLFARLHDGFGIGWTLMRFADLYRRHGRWDDAEAVLARCISVRRDAGDRWGEAEALARRGDLAAERGLHDQATQAWRAARDLFDDLADPRADDLRARLSTQHRP